MRLQGIVNNPPAIMVQETEGKTIPLLNKELKHCAAVIAAAFLNPCKFTLRLGFEIVLID
jgi:hypothetical protein